MVSIAHKSTLRTPARSFAARLPDDINHGFSGSLVQCCVLWFLVLGVILNLNPGLRALDQVWPKSPPSGRSQTAAMLSESLSRHGRSTTPEHRFLLSASARPQSLKCRARSRSQMSKLLRSFAETCAAGAGATLAARVETRAFVPFVSCGTPSLLVYFLTSVCVSGSRSTCSRLMTPDRASENAFPSRSANPLRLSGSRYAAVE